MSSSEAFIPPIVPKWAQDTCSRADELIRRLNDLEYEVKAEARDTIYERKDKRIWQNKEKRTISDQLSAMITDYVGSKSDKINQRTYNNAVLCIGWFNRMFASGLIKEGQGLFAKLAKCQTENERLQKENDMLSDELLKAKGLI